MRVEVRRVSEVGSDKKGVGKGELIRVEGKNE